MNYIIVIILKPYYTTDTMIILEHNHAATPFQRVMNFHSKEYSV